MSHQAHPGHPFSGGVHGFPGGEFVVGIDVQALIEKQRVVMAERKSQSCGVVFGGELVTVELSKLRSDEWRDLVSKHPPRKGTTDSDAGFNPLTLPAAFPADSILFGDSVVTAESWENIFSLLEPGAQDEIAGMAYKLHVLDPYLKLVVLGKAALGGRSGSPVNRESRRVASKGGSQRKSRATSTTKKAD